MRLSEISQTKRQALYAITHMCNLKKYNKVVNIKKKQKTHIYREQMSGYQWEGGGCQCLFTQLEVLKLGVPTKSTETTKCGNKVRLSIP